MAPPKSLVLAALLVAIVATGQVPRGAGLGGGASPNTNTSVVIAGTVPCPTGNSINTATAAPFPNAALLLRCNGQVIAGATADGNGAFVLSFPGASTEQLKAIMGNQCKLVVSTPLAACDASLAGITGTLMTPLKFMGISTTGGGSGDPIGIGGIINLIFQIINGLIGGIVNFIPTGFSLV